MKKQLIMDKSLELFAEQGFEATTVQQITNYCQISKGAFYLYFTSKDELIYELIDQFMQKFISDIDHIVINALEKDHLLFIFYSTIFDSFQKHSDFAKILLTEQTNLFNKELILKLRYFDKQLGNIILSIVQRVYGADINSSKYDLVYCIKGFIDIHSRLLLFKKNDVDLELLSKSLVEKTDLLAKNISIPFITEDVMHIVEDPVEVNVTKEQVISEASEKQKELKEGTIEEESVSLLLQHLQEPFLSNAIVNGLIENIKNHQQCSWFVYLLRKYLCKDANEKGGA
ncbi:TetR/AcrR family transcriptional regulator [Oceanobacillus sp. 1P07AA]|uniref:TetR/AcrR family transcriptional regulator n=1 Tax=Oceanobacillus sp. 1P07AA TaxID=3132293 RepID=UPI0039A460F0